MYTTHINTQTDIALYVYRFMYRYSVLLYASCADEMYFCVHNCALLYNFTLPTHTCGAHSMLGSVVLLYIYTEARFSMKYYADKTNLTV